MPYLLHGALIEYGTDFLGPIPNVVIFQFNPETLTRNLEIPSRPTASKTKVGDVRQSGDTPSEKISFTAHFNAADQLGAGNPLARAFGIGPRLAALEKMARPAPPGGILGQMVDAFDALVGAAKGNPRSPIPRDLYPRLLFIWGPNRILPVIIASMNITEQQFDAVLNPVEAEVSLGLSVITPGKDSKDTVAMGALAYTDLAKNAQVLANLPTTAGQIVDLIPF